MQRLVIKKLVASFRFDSVSEFWSKTPTVDEDRSESEEQWTSEAQSLRQLNSVEGGVSPTIRPQLEEVSCSSSLDVLLYMVPEELLALLA